MNKQDYYRNRDDSFYTKYTKHEILERVKEEGAAAAAELLREMDYPWIEDQWRRCEGHFEKYITMMRLQGYQNFRWKDGSDRLKPLTLTVENSFFNVSKLMSSERIVLTKRDDGDWNCVFEFLGFDGEKHIPMRLTGVIDKSEIPAIFNFKLNDECLYKVEVIDSDAANS